MTTIKAVPGILAAILELFTAGPAKPDASAVFKPFAYVQFASAEKQRAVISDFSEFMQRVVPDENRERVKTRFNRVLDEIDRYATMIDTRRPVKLYLEINSSLARTVVTKGPDKLQPADVFAVTLEMPVYDADRVRDEIREFSDRGQVAHRFSADEKTLYLFSNPDVSAGKKTEDIYRALKLQTAFRSGEYKPAGPADGYSFYYLVDFSRVEKLLQTDPVKKLIYLKSGKLPEFASSDLYLLVWGWRLYAAYYYQSLMLSPAPLEGSFLARSGENEFTFTLNTRNDTGNRPFYSGYRARRELRMSELRRRGQKPVGIESDFYVSVPLPLKTWFESMQSYQSDDIFFMKDIYALLPALTDLATVRDSRSELWAQIDLNTEFYLLKNNDATARKIIPGYNYLYLLDYRDLELPRALLSDIALIEKIKADQTEAGQGGAVEPNSPFLSRVSDGLFRVERKGITAYIALKDGEIAVSDNLDVLKRYTGSERQSSLIRVEKAAGVEGSENSLLPALLTADTDALAEAFSQSEFKRLDEVSLQLLHEGRADYSLQFRMKAVD